MNRIARDLMIIASELLKYYPESYHSEQNFGGIHYRCPKCNSWMRRYPQGQEKIYLCSGCKQKWEMQLD